MPARRTPKTWEEYVGQLGIALQRRRQDLGLSQEDVAHRAGVTRNYYQQLERGRLSTGKPANPTLKVLVNLARALELSINGLVPDPEGLRIE